MKSLIIVLLVATLVGCGGGGGNAPATSTAPATTTYYSNPTLVGTFQPLNTTTPHSPLMDYYAKDLNFDGVDEIIIVGLRTASPSSKTFNVQIYGWNTGTFANETATWFNGNDNVIEGSSKVVFGDFDNDNYIDFALNADTDTDSVQGSTLVFFNNGTSFTRTNITSGTPWSHDIVAADFNGDNIPDIMVLDYGSDVAIHLSNGDRTFTTYNLGNVGYSGSGLSVADYQPGGNLEVVITDNGSNNIDDTHMFAYNAGSLTSTGVNFPGSRYTSVQAAAQTHSKAHAIRNIPFDFDGDGDLDIVVVERLDNENTLQFLRNDGNGLSFTDVSDSKLVNYNTLAASSGYNITLTDFNNDGKQDIYTSGSSFDGFYGYTQLLIQSSEGQFVSAFSDVFEDFVVEIVNRNANGNETGLPVRIIKGPNEQYYMMGIALTYADNDVNKQYLANVYISRLGARVAGELQSTAELATAPKWPFQL